MYARFGPFMITLVLSMVATELQELSIVGKVI